nr:hypothetical protein [uncultured Pseudogulbenkiania sp.]
MAVQLVLWLAIALFLVGGAFVLFVRRRHRSTNIASELAVTKQVRSTGGEFQNQQTQLPDVKPTLPQAIVLGDDAQRPGVRIAPLSDEERFRSAKPLPKDSVLAGKLSAGLQAVPTLLIEEGHRGKRLMEVVINGDLVRAKDGVGLRAWTLDANSKISEHAKLFDSNNLQTMVNAAAVWQLASVVVAQKHLADISTKLDDIREGVQEISHFLSEERRAQITGTYKYLELAASAVSMGELSPAIRAELESCERDLLKVQDHLQQELQRLCEKPVEHKEMFGTEDLLHDTVAKYNNLKDLLKDMRLTLKTRALAWYVLSLYPGEPALKQARMQGLLSSAEEIEARLQIIEKNADRDCEKFTSWWNKDTTLAIRKTNVRKAAKALSDDLLSITAETRTDVLASDARLLSYDAPTHVVFEVENGRISSLKIAEPIPAAG